MLVPLFRTHHPVIVDFLLNFVGDLDFFILCVELLGNFLEREFRLFRRRLLLVFFVFIVNLLSVDLIAFELFFFLPGLVLFDCLAIVA